MRVACIYFNDPPQLQDFAESCLRFSPQICIRQNEAVFIEIGRCKSLFSEEQFFERVYALTKAFNLQANVTIRDCVIQALVSAKYGTDDYSKIPISALPLFSDPYGFTKPDQEIEKMEEILKKVGIKVISEFSALSEAQLSTRFGKMGVFWKRQVDDPSNLPWPKWKPRESIIETLTLSHDDSCGSIEPLLFK
jgi:hypothetical protein